MIGISTALWFCIAVVLLSGGFALARQAGYSGTVGLLVGFAAITILACGYLFMLVIVEQLWPTRRSRSR